MSCGISEEEIREQIALKEQIKKLNLSKCKKCNGQPFLVLQKREVLCKLCFKDYCESKFRTTIGKTKMIRPNQKILIAYSGGQSSTAMLNLTLISLNDNDLNSTLKLIKPYLLYIDGDYYFLI